MRKLVAFVLFGALLLSAPCVRSDDEVEDDDSDSAAVEDDEEYEDVLRALLVVVKSHGIPMSEEDGVFRAVQGRNVTITLSIYNAGST